MKVIVTGGCGLVGAHLIRALVKRSCDVVVVDDLSATTNEYLSDLPVTLQRKSILDNKLGMSFAGADFVYHLAAKGNVVESMTDPLTNFHVNVEGTVRVLEAIRSSGARAHLIFASTGGALMGDTPPPVNEMSQPAPISPYGASKLAAEEYIKAYHRAFGMSYTILRFGNVVGEYCLHKAGAVNKFFNAVMKGEAIEIFGSPSRDIIYAGDLAECMSKICEASPKTSETYHLASGRAITVRDIAEVVIKWAATEQSQLRYRPRRAGEVEATFADISKAQRELGFSVSHSPEEAIVKALNWLRSHS